MIYNQLLDKNIEELDLAIRIDPYPDETFNLYYLRGISKSATRNINLVKDSIMKLRVKKLHCLLIHDINDLKGDKSDLIYNIF